MNSNEAPSTQKTKTFTTNKDAIAKRRKNADYLVGAFFAFSAFFLSMSELPFETSPFGLALLSASSKYIPFIFFGILISTLSKTSIDFLYMSAVLIIIISRVICRIFIEPYEKDKKLFSYGIGDTFLYLFSESVAYRMLSGTIGGFTLGLFRVIINGFKYFDLFSALFYIISIPILTFLYAPFFAKKEKEFFDISLENETKFEKNLYKLSILTIFVTLTYSAKSVWFFGLSLSIVSAFFLTFYFSKKGKLWGVIAGALLGLSVKPLYAPMFLLVGLISSFTIEISVGISATIATVVGIAYTFLLGGTSDFLSAFPALITASLLYTTAERVKLFDGISSINEKTKADKKETTVKALSNEKVKFYDKNIKKLSKSFSELSGVFDNFSNETKRPQLLDIRTITEEVFDKHCPSCPNITLCFGAESEKMADRINRISTSNHIFGKTSCDKLDKPFLSRCKNLKEISTEIDREVLLAKRKYFDNSSFSFSLDFEAFSALISEALLETNEEFSINLDLTKKVNDILNDENLKYDSAIVYGKHKTKLLIDGFLIENPSKIDFALNILKKRIERAFSFRFTNPEIEISDNILSVRAERQKQFDITCGEYSVSKDEKTNCGDSSINFEDENGYFYSIISDGMGSGREACEVSNLCISFLKTMLVAGNHKKTSIKMLNNILKIKNSDIKKEISSSIDLLEIDLLSGTVALLKCGASPSFLYRNHKITKLFQSSPPIGIIDEIEIKELNFDVLNDDIFILLSDGAYCGLNESELVTIIESGNLNNPQDICKAIAEYAKQNGSKDDITVNFIKIKNI